jgi:hypothetical protein
MPREQLGVYLESVKWPNYRRHILLNIKWK